MTEIEQLLERQSRWQKSRAALSWAEKLRLAETLRDAALALRGGQQPPPAPDPRSRANRDRDASVDRGQD